MHFTRQVNEWIFNFLVSVFIRGIRGFNRIAQDEWDARYEQRA